MATACNTGVYLVIPQNLRIEDLPPKFRRKPDRAHYPISLVLNGQHKEKKSQADFIPISQEMLRDFIHARHGVLTALREYGILECDGKFCPGAKSLGYRLAPKYRGELRQVECQLKSLAETIKEHRIRIGKDPVSVGKLPQLYRYLYDWMSRTTILKEPALQVLHQSRNSEDYLFSSQGVEDIHQGQWGFVVCDKGRVHTPITRLAKEARKYLRIDGQALQGWDLANAQPLFLSLIINQVGHGLHELGSEHPLPRREPQPPPTISCTTFSDLALSGQLYDYLAPKLETTRESLKRDLFTYVLYSKPLPWMINHPVSQLFKQEFPEVWKFIQQEKAGDHSNLACRLQKAESDFFILGVCERLRNEALGFPKNGGRDGRQDNACSKERCTWHDGSLPASSGFRR